MSIALGLMQSKNGHLIIFLGRMLVGLCANHYATTLMNITRKALLQVLSK